MLPERVGPESLNRQIHARRVATALLNIPENYIERVILFGSSARGDALPDDKIDLCVTFLDNMSNPQVTLNGVRLKNVLEGMGFHVRGGSMPLDFSFFRQAFFDGKEETYPVLESLIKKIKAEGIVLYSKTED